jgi:ribosomal RNA-processing protein 8
VRRTLYFWFTLFFLIAMGKKNKKKKGDIERGKKSKPTFKPTPKPSKQEKKDQHTKIHNPAASKLSPLQQKMKEQLESSRFRWINEQLYTTTSNEALALMKESPEYFEVYHKGYRAQVEKWPVNPVDAIIAWLNKQKELVVVDLGIYR